MSEDNAATSGQEQETGQVQETTDSTKATETTEKQKPTEATSSEAKTVDDLPDWAKKEIKDLRKESAGNRKKLKDIEDKDKSELEKANSELEELRTEREKWQRERTASAFRTQINLPSPRLALGAARELNLTVELDDSGNVKDLDSIRKALKKEYPREFGDGSADGSDTGQKPKANDMNAAIRAAAGRG